LYISKGFAHGFKALTDECCVHYLQTSVYSKENDHGVRFDSFGFDWEIEKPIISERDQGFPALKDFETPFT
jgi:dTDP-4-dehydrorhamnose 3,5-epimerase-like enzyme